MPAGRPRALLYAYSCEPGRGSEPEAGWGIVQAVSRIADCTVLLPDAHAGLVRAHLSAHPNPSIAVVEVPEGRWARRAKWHRIPWFVAYLAWLRRAGRTARRLHAMDGFDLSHHVTYSVYWLPTPAATDDAPSVWGPVGGAVVTPRRLWRLLGWRGIIDELVDRASVRGAARSRSTTRTWRRADVRLVQNVETLERLPPTAQTDTVILNHALFIAPPNCSWDGGRDVVWVAGLESRKGPRLAVRALAATHEDVRLVMIGDGPERRSVARLARRLGVSHRLDLPGRIPREEVLDRMSHAAAVLFTGLREEGGVALAEAAMIGTPLVVLAHGGARAVVGNPTDPDRVALVEPADVATTARHLGEAMEHFVRHAPTGRGSLLDTGIAFEALRAAYDRALGRSGS